MSLSHVYVYQNHLGISHTHTNKKILFFIFRSIILYIFLLINGSILLFHFQVSYVLMVIVLFVWCTLSLSLTLVSSTSSLFCFDIWKRYIDHGLSSSLLSSQSWSFDQKKEKINCHHNQHQCGQSAKFLVVIIAHIHASEHYIIILIDQYIKETQRERERERKIDNEWCQWFY